MTDPADPSRPTDPSAPPEPDPGTLGPQWQGRWDRLPRAVRVLLLVLGLGALLFLVRVLPDLLFEDRSTGRTVYTVGIGLLAVVMIVFSVRRARRVLGGAEQLRMFRQALKDGEVPPTANRDAWRAALERQQRSMRWAHRFNVVVYVVPAVVLVGGIVVITASGKVSLAAAVPLVVLGIAALAAIWFASRSLRKQRERSAALLEQL